MSGMARRLTRIEQHLAPPAPGVVRITLPPCAGFDHLGEIDDPRLDDAAVVVALPAMAPSVEAWEKMMFVHAAGGP